MSDVTARVLLHLRRVPADFAVLASFCSKEPGDAENKRSQGSPNCSLRCRVIDAMALEQLHSEDDRESSKQDSKKTLDPESSAQEIPLVSSDEVVEKTSCDLASIASRGQVGMGMARYRPVDMSPQREIRQRGESVFAHQKEVFLQLQRARKRRGCWIGRLRVCG